MLGVPRLISLNPTLDSAGRQVVANVVRDQSPTGRFRTTKRGPSRTRLAYAWNWLEEDDYDELTSAYSDCDEGAKAILVQDELDILRWMQITSATLDPIPVAGPDSPSGFTTAIKLELEESV